MSDFQMSYDLTQNETLRTKVRMATIKAANDILADTTSADASAKWPFCRFVIREPQNNFWLDQIMFSVVTNPQITDQSPDNDIQFQVNSVFSKHALANPNI